MKTEIFKTRPISALPAALLLATLACRVGNPPATAIPAVPPVQFEVQTATPTTDPKIALTPQVGESASVLPLGDAPTHTPDPNAPPTPALIDTSSPSPTPNSDDVGNITLTAEPITPTTVAVTPKPRPPVEPDPPRQGGDWDFETEFVPWANPYGEPCPGGRIASGWTAFVEDGPYGSSCLNENLYQPNVLSGLKSQEITFDFISANSGVLRTIPTKVGHRYNIMAYAKHDHSISPVEMALGVDLTGGAVWNAETVQWFAWDNSSEDAWSPTEETVTATGESMTIFIKGFHPMADQGGKTVVDNVSITDLGAE